MTTSEHKSRSDETAMAQEVASAVNLMAHPMAGAAAMGALGLGFASQAVGMWLGAMAGAAEASHRLLNGVGEVDDAAPAAPKPAKLKLVVSRPETNKPKPVKSQRRAAKAEAVAAPVATKPEPVARPQTQDDLKQISGVGPKLEKVLNGLGFWSYAQIAALTPEQIAWLDSELGFAGRIGRDDWIGQAKALSGAN